MTTAKTKSKAKPKSATTFIYEQVIQNPDISVDDLTKAVRKKGHKMKDDTITAYRSWARQFIGIATRLGKWKS